MFGEEREKKRENGEKENKNRFACNDDRMADLSHAIWAMTSTMNKFCLTFVVMMIIKVEKYDNSV